MTAHRPARRRGARGVVRPAAWLGLLAGVAGALLAARPAQAFVRYKTSTGIGFFWPQTCVPVTAYPLSMTDANGHMDMTSQQIMQAATSAAAAWGANMNACTFLRINVTESTGPTPEARDDYTNSLIFRTLTWCSPSDAPGTCSYDPSALAITSVFVDKSTGQIQDGDIEVNARNFSWADLVLDPSLASQSQDLQNALTHETGHLIGLDHTCYVPGTVPNPPLDNTGTPVPSCDAASDAVKATTMSALAEPGDTGKRTLAPDDIAAVCDIYPIAMDPMKCPVTDAAPSGAEACRCGLGADGGGGRAGALLAGLAALAALVRRRRAVRS